MAIFETSLELPPSTDRDEGTNDDTGAPHPLQNLASGGSSFPHMRQNMELNDPLCYLTLMSDRSDDLPLDEDLIRELQTLRNDIG